MCLELQIRGSDRVPETTVRMDLIVVPQRVEDLAGLQLFPATQKMKEIFSHDVQILVEPGDEIIVELVEPGALPSSVILNGKPGLLVARPLTDLDRLVLHHESLILEQYIIRKTEIVDKISGIRLATISYAPNAAAARQITITIPRMGKSLSGTQFIDIIKGICFENKSEATPVSEHTKPRMKAGLPNAVQMDRTKSFAFSGKGLKGSFKGKLVQRHLYPVCRITFNMYGASEGDTKLETTHYVIFDETQ